MHNTRLWHSGRNKFAAALFRYAYKKLFQRFVIDVAKVHIEELQTAQFFKLLFHAATNFHRIGQADSHIFFAVRAIGMHEF